MTAEFSNTPNSRGNGNPAKPSPNLETALELLKATIGEREFFVRVSWSHGDLDVTGLQLHVEPKQIRILLGPETNEGHARGVLRLHLPTTSREVQPSSSVDDGFFETTLTETEPDTEWKQHFGQDGQVGLSLYCPPSDSAPGAIQQIWIASGAELLATMIGESGSPLVQ